MSIVADTYEELPEPAPKSERQYADDGTPEGTAADRRATLAGVAVKAYGRATWSGGEDLYVVLGDLLCDLRHLTDALGLEWGELAERGRKHYEAERTGS